ncbi:methionine gamma-lyase family protein [Bacillus pumilus]|nr:methionine gamma-lyase family protein [Bacillus pumilus]
MYGDVLGGERGVVGPQMICGRDGIWIGLLGVVRGGDELIYMMGKG